MSWFMRWEQFMRTDLGLKGSELYVYAVIYGFTKSKGNFSGSLKYLEEVTGFTTVQCCNTLKSLVGKGLIDKKSIQNKKGFLQSEYTAVPLDELTLPEKQEKPKRKTKQKTADKPSKIITDCETQGDLYQGIGDTEKPQENENKPPDFELTAIDEKPKPPKIRQPESEVLDPEKQLRLETWQYYKQAYLERYGIEPVRNARVNRNILDFVKQVGANAPQMIYFFVFHNNSWYVQKGHDTGTLLQNVQAIARDWAKGYQTTQTYAKQGESVATAQMAAQGAIELLNSIREEKAKRQQGA